MMALKEASYKFFFTLREFNLACQSTGDSGYSCRHDEFSAVAPSVHHVNDYFAKLFLLHA
ncbi:hypothetical protein [Obesumbacterium proteus]|uniref:hypothetical protein n=1 Tax=Obesumbacterium proteus TaxID=82983 RepID=UPI00243136F1|nr:hypothetical protein [Obesumbacterium proteus]